MNIEFIALWVITGIITDILCMAFLAYTSNREEVISWERFKLERGLPASLGMPVSDTHQDHTTISMIKESPWWAHIILVAFPPAALSIPDTFSN